MAQSTPFGYLLVHFVEDNKGHGERVYFTLSDGDTPLRWSRANHGYPILESTLGSTGVRDPFLVRNESGAFLIATDLRIHDAGKPDWDDFTRHGSRCLVVWHSPDLIHWGEPWLAEVAPPEAGMAWAPEATYDTARGVFIVYWSSTLFAAEDFDHAEQAYSRILVAETKNFRDFSPSQVLIDRGSDVIDVTMVIHNDKVYRFAKNNSEGAGSLLVYQEVGSGIRTSDFDMVRHSIGSSVSTVSEAPLVFRDHSRGDWYLWLDRYDDKQGYFALRATDIALGDWSPVSDESFELPQNTKHGVVVPLVGDEWQRLASAFPVAQPTEQQPRSPTAAMSRAGAGAPHGSQELTTTGC